jgi:hypothetical protein
MGDTETAFFKGSGDNDKAGFGALVKALRRQGG